MKNCFIAEWIRTLLEERPIRANSLIITIYGDSIDPHGGSVWLGSFIQLVKPFGINDRLVRTSVFRLSRDGWLTSKHIGRRSYYDLTAMGRRRFQHAHRRIYFLPEADWEGDWQIVLMPGSELCASLREDVRKELQWEGFGLIAPHVLAHPSADTGPLLDILRSNHARDKVVVLLANSLEGQTTRPMQELVRECWSLDLIADDYKRLIERFEPLHGALQDSQQLDPEQSFMVRTLLMHEFRRTLLRDPQLPHQLLPADWPGSRARQLCQDIYQLTQKSAKQHLMTMLETAEGPLPAAVPFYYERFGGMHAE